LGVVASFGRPQPLDDFDREAWVPARFEPIEDPARELFLGETLVDHALCDRELSGRPVRALHLELGAEELAHRFESKRTLRQGVDVPNILGGMLRLVAGTTEACDEERGEQRYGGGPKAGACDHGCLRSECPMGRPLRIGDLRSVRGPVDGETPDTESG